MQEIKNLLVERAEVKSISSYWRNWEMFVPQVSRNFITLRTNVKTYIVLCFYMFFFYFEDSERLTNFLVLVFSFSFQYIFVLRLFFELFLKAYENNLNMSVHE